MTALDSLTKAARLCYMVMLLDRRGPGRPRKREFDTAVLAERLGVSRRSIQRDIHVAQRVREILAGF